MRLFSRAFAMLALVLAFVAPMQGFAAQNGTDGAAIVEDKNVKGLFVFITEDDPMTQMMALVLSTQTLQQGKSVHILLCDAAGELAIKGSAETVFKPLNKSPQMLLRGLIAKGVKVELCPLYLPNTGKSQADVVDGVTIAKPPVIAKGLREEGIRLFTF